MAIFRALLGDSLFQFPDITSGPECPSMRLNIGHLLFALVS